MARNPRVDADAAVRQITSGRQGYVDLSDRHRRRRAAQNVTTMFNAASPKVKEAGMHWYEDVHEATAKGVKGTSTSVQHGAAIVAAVSPNMDWDNKNINALSEIHTLRGADWAKIRGGDKSPVAGMSIRQASVSNLTKAHRLLEGEDPEDVLPRQSAPKTNSFYSNIHEPDKPGHVTIDGRAHDIAANRLQSWKSDRGISSAALKSGKKTRYEDFEDTYRTAADALVRQHGHDVLPHQVQAVTWEMGKLVERSGTTKTGQPRKQGVFRAGQPYVGRSGLLPTPPPHGR